MRYPDHINASIGPNARFEINLEKYLARIGQDLERFVLEIIYLGEIQMERFV